MKKHALPALFMPLFLILTACTDVSEEEDVVHVPYENGTEAVPTHEIRTDQGVTFHFGENYELSDEELIISDASLITHTEKEMNIIINRHNEEHTLLNRRELENGDYFAEYDFIEVDVDTTLFPNLTNLGVYERDDNVFTGLILYKGLNEEEFLYVETTMAPDHFTDDFKTELLAFFNTIKRNEENE
ncbi:hypothetical protein MM326_18840 [Alkalihalobacillus sp. LMS6]|uniref:hypothetical protein n=1 Tax=Alkalihalobacillus sp. LMS6 TaxID=2924034 RepID=UPI0020D04F04|nr:hypothetical protein [Alkalihalobacillus sp. LMS6]UTR06109.1 hypothetical protein MM326_18840 [Alkalihalobacillus sp. LMS6]